LGFDSGIRISEFEIQGYCSGMIQSAQLCISLLAVVAAVVVA
jgi:hypothetical protein